MKTITNALHTLCCVLRFAQQAVRYVGLFVWALLCPKALAAARLMTPQANSPAAVSGSSKLVSIPVLGGLHQRYMRVAA